MVVLLGKAKGELSEVEQQLKKAEVAQRRRMQVEKAARESEVWPHYNCYICLSARMNMFNLFLSCLFGYLFFLNLRLRLLEKSWAKIPLGRNGKRRLRNIKKILSK